MAPAEGFEPPIAGLEARCPIHLNDAGEKGQGETVQIQRLRLLR